MISQRLHTTIAKYTLLEFLRARVLVFSVVLLLGIVLLAEFAAETTITEALAAKGILYAFVSRLMVVLILTIYICNNIAAEFNEKRAELFLSLPMPRAEYLFGKLLGYLAAALLLTSVIGIVALLYAAPIAALYWWLSLLLELGVVICLCLFFSLSFRSSTVSIGCVLAFYLLARSMGALLLISGSNIVQTGTLTVQLMESLLGLIALLLPDLWRFASSDWLVYGAGEISDLGINIAQAIIYMLLISAAALFDLYRKNL